jgi:hypothetical protein
LAGAAELWVALGLAARGLLNPLWNGALLGGAAGATLTSSFGAADGYALRHRPDGQVPRRGEAASAALAAAVQNRFAARSLVTPVAHISWEGANR